MAEWTPEAKEYLEGYLRQVAALARQQGDDADEIVAELRGHIQREAEEAAGVMVTLDVLRKTLSGIGTPEQVTGVEAALTPAWRDKSRGAAETSSAPRTGQGATAVPVPPQQLAPPTVVVQQPRARSGCLSLALAFAIMAVVSLVGLAILGIIVSIALPSLARARAEAREKAAVENLKAIASAEEQFRSAGHKDADGDGVSDYGTLDELTSEGALDKKVAEGLIGLGYEVEVFLIPTSQPRGPAFTCMATPEGDSSSGLRLAARGRRRISIDQTGEVIFPETPPTAGRIGSAGGT
jgi:hypothetical protein